MTIANIRTLSPSHSHMFLIARFFWKQITLSREDVNATGPSPLVSSRKTINRWVFPGVSESDPIKPPGRRWKTFWRIWRFRPDSEPKKKRPPWRFLNVSPGPEWGYEKRQFGTKLWWPLASASQELCFFCFRHVFFLQGGRVVVARVRRGFSEWFGTSGWHLWIRNLHPGSVARRLLFGHYRFGVKDSAIIEEWLWLDAPPSLWKHGSNVFPLWITMVDPV